MSDLQGEDIAVLLMWYQVDTRDGHLIHLKTSKKKKRSRHSRASTRLTTVQGSLVKFRDYNTNRVLVGLYFIAHCIEADSVEGREGMQQWSIARIKLDIVVMCCVPSLLDYQDHGSIKRKKISIRCRWRGPIHSFESCSVAHEAQNIQPPKCKITRILSSTLWAT